MKKLLILALLVIVVGGLYISKPKDPKRSFEHYLKDQGDNELIAKLTAESCDYQDRYLWVDVVQKDDGKVVYTNVFHNWFNRAEVKKKAKEDLNTARNAVNETVEKGKEKLSRP